LIDVDADGRTGGRARPGAELSAIEIPAGRRVGGEVTVPPSKSLTHRLLLLALLGRREVIVERPLRSADTERLVAAVRACGCSVTADGSGLIVAPGDAPRSPVELACGASGTLLRLLTGVVAGLPGEWRLDGVRRLRQRPVAALVAALGELGADIDYRGRPGFAPLRIRGRALAGGSTRLDASESSQFLSALILASLSADGPVTIETEGLASRPYVDLTLDAVALFGGRAGVADGVWHVEPGLAPPARVIVEGDYSAAAYFAAAAALAGGAVRLRGLAPVSRQGDRRLLDLLASMGARVEPRRDGFVVAGGGPLEALDVDLRDLPDQVPTLAALAPFARGVTRIRGVAHLRLKESDRLAALRCELERAGAPADETDDGLEIPGVWAETAPPGSVVRIDSHDDHRIAMSMALVGLRRPGLSIARPEVVAKSYPGFWQDLFAVLR
jgi:3-phosphoshikimate 1-carboxyvinyltransferase